MPGVVVQPQSFLGKGYLYTWNLFFFSLVWISCNTPVLYIIQPTFGMVMSHFAAAHNNTHLLPGRREVGTYLIIMIRNITWLFYITLKPVRTLQSNVDTCITSEHTHEDPSKLFSLIVRSLIQALGFTPGNLSSYSENLRVSLYSYTSCLSRLSVSIMMGCK